MSSCYLVLQMKKRWFTKLAQDHTLERGPESRAADLKFELVTISPNSLGNLPAKGTRTKGRKRVRVTHALSPSLQSDSGVGTAVTWLERSGARGALIQAHLPCKALWKATVSRRSRASSFTETPPNLSSSPLSSPATEGGSREQPRKLEAPRSPA